jgi:DNA-binding NarL/FixJ family response regulator
MEESCASVLIIARPGPLRDGLQALLTAMPQIDTVEWACDLSSALDMTSEHCPALVFLDAGTAGSEISLTLRRAKAKWPQAQCMFLANDVQQQREAEDASADAALLKGFPAAKLVATIAGLLLKQAA